jgi:hypothetical protein
MGLKDHRDHRHQMDHQDHQKGPVKGRRPLSSLASSYQLCPVKDQMDLMASLPMDQLPCCSFQEDRMALTPMHQEDSRAPTTPRTWVASQVQSTRSDQDSSHCPI